MKEGNGRGGRLRGDGTGGVRETWLGFFSLRSSKKAGENRDGALGTITHKDSKGRKVGGNENSNCVGSKNRPTVTLTKELTLAKKKETTGPGKKDCREGKRED